MRHALLVDEVQVLVIVDHAGLGAHQVAVVEGVLVGVRQADVLARALEVGELVRDRGDGLDGDVDVLFAAIEVVLDFLQGLPGGHEGEPAGRQRDRVNVPAADGFTDDVADLLELEGALDDVGVRRGQRDDAGHAQGVGRGQEVHVQDVALDFLGHQHELAQGEHLGRELGAEGVVGGLDAGGGVSDRADAADAAGQQAGVAPGKPLDHALEDAGRLDDVEPARFDLAVDGPDGDVAVALDAGYVVNVNV